MSMTLAKKSHPIPDKIGKVFLMRDAQNFELDDNSFDNPDKVNISGGRCSEGHFVEQEVIIQKFQPKRYNRWVVGGFVITKVSLYTRD